MSQGERVKEIVFAAIEKYNRRLPQERRLEKSLGTMLLEGDENLDSLEFLNLAMMIEKEIGKEFNMKFTVFDVNVMAKKDHPFRTVKTLLEYIEELLKCRLGKENPKG